jgi:transcriptional regulator with XRE-family HTH domain
MIKHRIKEIRVNRGLSQADLGKLVFRSKSQISRIEAGAPLDLDIAQKIANVLNVSLAELLGLDGSQDYSNDVTRYTPSQTDVWALKNRSYFVVETDALDYAGYKRGTIIEVNTSNEAVASLQPLDAVIVEFTVPGGRKKSLLFRQFMPPALLITNCTKANARSIDIAKERTARIVGVVTANRPSHIT